MNKEEPTPKSVVVQPQFEEREDFQEEKRDKDMGVETEDMITLEKVEKS